MELFVSLEPEDVEKIAHLARLRIEAQDIPGYARNLSEILALVERMNSIDTQGVQPMAHPQDIHQRLRADEITESDQRDRFQKNAPQIEAGLYLVPKVIE
jgi:aspartyl-tRNA(Asn)/glutamyl-tRNA(Gln) amidotransferase subunit C